MSKEFEDIYSPDDGKYMEWQMISDQVMGGTSQGQVLRKDESGSTCDCLTGNVSLKNNGGFIQMQVDLENIIKPQKQPKKSGMLTHDFADYDGVFIEVLGSQHAYNLHFKSSQLWLPWQSFRKEINVSKQWQRLFIPFSEFKGYKTFSKFNPSKATSFAVLAIGEAFEAKVCVRRFGVYRNT